LRACWRAPLNV